MGIFNTPKLTFIGGNALTEAMPYIKECGEKALIVTGRHVGKSSMMKELTDELNNINLDYFIFDHITDEPTNIMISLGLETFINNNCDFLIGIGGGSPLDAAKAIAAMVNSDKDIVDFMGKEIVGDIPPIVAIPTTSGTGSEATKFTVITHQDTQVKMLLKGDKIIPKIAVVNPAFTVSMPKSITASTGADALTHAIEAYTSKKANKITDVLAVSAIKRIVKFLPVAYQNGEDLLAREEMSLAAYEAGLCINSSSVTLVHGMSRPIGALFHVPHGIANAMLLVKCLEFALDGAYDKFANLGREIGAGVKDDSDQTAAEKFLIEIEKVLKLCEIPNLKEYGINENEFKNKIEKMAGDAVASGSPANTIKPVTAADCKDIYNKLW